MIDGQLIEVVGGATVGGRVDESADRTSQRILDAALQEAAAVGLQRITVEEVVRRAGVSRMTAYRRYPRRDDLVEALVRRETQRFLAAVADAIDAVEDPHDGVAEAFIAAVTFAREHPMLRRAGQLEPAPIADSVELLTMGSAFIANYIHGEAPGTPSQQGALGGRRVRPVVLHLHLDAAHRSELRRRRRTAAVRARGADADGGAR